MIVEDGGAVYTGQALRMKYRNLVEAGLQNEDGRVRGAANGAVMESGRVGELDEDAEMGSFDEWDRELMGDEDAGLEDESADEDGGTMSEMSRAGRRQSQRQRQRRSVELPRYRDGLEGEYDEDDEAFMDGELVGGGEDDMSE